MSQCLAFAVLVLLTVTGTRAETAVSGLQRLWQAFQPHQNNASLSMGMQSTTTEASLKLNWPSLTTESSGIMAHINQGFNTQGNTQGYNNQEYNKQADTTQGFNVLGFKSQAYTTQAHSIQTQPDAYHIGQSMSNTGYSTTDTPCGKYSTCTTTNPFISTTEGNREAHSTSYCDERQYTSDVLRSNSLDRAGYFVYNTSCSCEYFHCSNGITHPMRCPTEQQAFDPDSQTCNYRYNIKFCQENKSDSSSPSYIITTPSFSSSSPSSASCANCDNNQFACCAGRQQKCVDLSKRCDGQVDCVDGSDELNCPSCSGSQYACVKSGKCIPASKHCNGIEDDCGDGSNFDEYNCGNNTSGSHTYESTTYGSHGSTTYGSHGYASTTPSVTTDRDSGSTFLPSNKSCVAQYTCQNDEDSATKCISYSRYCDGKRDCPNGDDESQCKKPGIKHILCENQKQSVIKQQWCNGQADCMDGSDEKYCF